MNAKDFKNFAASLASYTIADPITPSDALALAAYVVNHIITHSPSTSADEILVKGIMLHAMHQIDAHHGQAKRLGL